MEVRLWWWIAAAWAQELPNPPALPTNPPPATPVAAPSAPAPAPTTGSLFQTPTTGDTAVHVYADGRVSVNGKFLPPEQLPAEVRRITTSYSGTRFLLDADTSADHGAVLQAMKTLDGAHVAWALAPAATPDERAPDPLFPGKPGVLPDKAQLAAQKVTPLESISKDDLEKLKPKRYRLPQNPYGSTDFTAYTLEWGETKLGLLGITVGVLPRVQLGTNPLLDGLGVYNGSFKANIFREGPADIALTAQVYHVPVNRLVRRFDERYDLGLFGETLGGEDIFAATLGYAGVGAMTSVQISDPWSVHVGGYYGRVNASGQFDFEQIPTSIIPGLVDEILPDQGSIVPSIRGDVGLVRLATDIRFNRRDSLVIQYQGAIYARASAKAGFDFEEIPGEGEVDVMLGYGGMVKPSDIKYSSIISAAWQFQWKHWEARAGIGWSATPYAWVLQPFQLAYRFGGATRSDERRMLSGFRENMRDLRKGGDAPPAPPPPKKP